MRCVFIGGPLDGQLREVDGNTFSRGIVLVPNTTEISLDKHEAANLGPPKHHRYHIANGIARHESVSEEHCAQMIFVWKDLVRMHKKEWLEEAFPLLNPHDSPPP